MIQKSLQFISQTTTKQLFNKNLGLRNLPSFQFSQLLNKKNIQQPQRVDYPTADQYFPEELTPKQKEMPQLDTYLMEKVFQQKLRKPTDQRVAYFKQIRNGQTYHVFDASKIPLGRMCQQISLLVRGKHKPTYKYNRYDCGDRCIVVNAGDIFLTGKKALNKKIHYHTGFVGHLKTINYSEYLLNKPEQLIIYVISKQLPKNHLRKPLLNKIDIYRGLEHNMTDKFPNFVPSKPVYEFLQQESPENLALKKNMTITYSSSNEIPEEFKHLKYEQNNEIEVPFQERKKIFKMTPHNRLVQQAWRKYYFKAKRYRVYKPKQPKSKLPDIQSDDLYVNSQSQIRRWGISNLVKTDDAKEIDDESSKNKFFE